MKPTSKANLAKEIERAQMHVLEMALVAYTEDILGRVPSDKEILEHGVHIQFAATPLSVYEKDGKNFSRYFVWALTDAVALGFLNEKDPIALSIVRVPRAKWPPALSAYVAQLVEKKKEAK